MNDIEPEDVLNDDIIPPSRSVSPDELHEYVGEYTEKWFRTTKRMVERGYAEFCKRHRMLMVNSTMREQINRDAHNGRAIKRRRFVESLKHAA